MADKRLERLGLWIGVPGLIMQFIGGIALASIRELPIAAILLGVPGCVLLVVAIGLTAKAKGYPAYCGIVGIGFLAGPIGAVSTNKLWSILGILGLLRRRLASVVAGVERVAGTIESAQVIQAHSLRGQER